MSKLVFNPPDAETPGYLRRMQSALEFKDRLDAAGVSAQTVSAIVEFLLPYITEPQDRDQAREALLDASKTQFKSLLSAAMGEDPNPMA